MQLASSHVRTGFGGIFITKWMHLKMENFLLEQIALTVVVVGQEMVSNMPPIVSMESVSSLMKMICPLRQVSIERSRDVIMILIFDPISS